MQHRVGVLALQGAFEEHEASFDQLPEELKRQVKVTQIRKSEEMDRCDALVIPGGETTTMKIIAGCDDFMEHLRNFVHGGKGTDGVHRAPRPVWGTCAGLILLSDDVLDHLPTAGDLKEPKAKRCKYGAQVGGLAVATCRNFFGRQEQSFEASISPDTCVSQESDVCTAFSDYPAVFIRAPGILRVDSGARVLARVRHPAVSARSKELEDGVVVAAESSPRRILATAFHPELCQDSRIHRYFIEHFVLSKE